MSATSSLFTDPSLSRSRIWKASRSVLTCEGCSCDSAFPCVAVLETAGRGVMRGLGTSSSSGASCTVACRRGVRGSGAGLVTGLLVNLMPPSASPGFVGDVDGVVCRKADGDAGDTGRRNGEDRGDPYPSGDGLYGMACISVSMYAATSLSQLSYHVYVVVFMAVCEKCHREKSPPVRNAVDCCAIVAP